ncbi:MAG: extracellular solute-binding protein [Lachnospiraceae bacterium]|nr:extracellular solute-binding protein [Lachnospiraceae bacterium]
MKKMRKMVAILLTGAMALSLTACGGSETESTGGTEAAAVDTEADDSSARKSGDIEISVSTRYASDNPDESYYREMVEKFNEMDNGIHVTMDNISTESDYLDKLRTSFANGDTPNVFIEYGGSRCYDYLESDALLDFSSYLNEDQEWYDSFYDSMWGQSVYDGYDGIYGIPFKTYMVVLYYNKDIFAEQGLTPPATFDELLDCCAKLKEAGINPFQVGEKDVYRFGHFNNCLVVKSLGVDGVDKLASREIAYDGDEMMKTYQIMADMVEKGYFGENILDMDATTENAAFEDGKAAMHYDGTWYIANNLMGTDFYDHVGVVNFPAINAECENYNQGGNSDIWFASKLNKSDEEIEASVEFLKYITSTEYFAENNEVASAIYPAKFTPTVDTPENPLLDEVNKIVAATTDMRTDIQNYDADSSMLDTVRNALQGLAMGNSPEECAKQIMEEVNSFEQ